MSSSIRISYNEESMPLFALMASTHRFAFSGLMTGMIIEINIFQILKNLFLNE